MIVNKQRSHPDKDVGTVATSIVTKWRKAVEEEKARRAGGGSSTPKPAQKEEPKSNGQEEQWKGTDPAKRKYDSDGVDIKRTGQPTRDNCVGLIYNGLAFNSRASCTSVILKAMEVEKCAFQKYGGDTGDYRGKIRSLFSNLKNKQNKDLGPKVMSGVIPAEKFVAMTLEELKSEERKKEEEELQKDNMKRAQVPMAERSVSDALKCGKCGMKKVAYSQAQTRSADEPMTTFCECMNCGHRWKVRYCTQSPLHSEFMLT